MENRQIKILAIDDNPDNLISLKALVMEAFPSVEVFTALSGEKGIELAGIEDPDVILLDIVMPLMDGFEVCKRMKENRNLSDIPVVFVTALKGDKESRIRALECGAEAFLAKPIDESELTAQIRAMVKIKTANIEKRDETKKLARLVNEQTRELRKTYRATLNLLEDLNRENESRKKSEDALRVSEERLRLMMSRMQQGLAVHEIIVNTDGKPIDYRFLDVNDSFEQMTGLKRENIIGRTVLEVMPLVEQYWIEAYGKVALTGETAQFENYTEVLDKYFEVVAYSPQHGQFAVIISDITKRKKTEDALRQSEKKYRTLTESMKDVVWVLDTETMYFTYISPSVERLRGYTLEEIACNPVDSALKLEEGEYLKNLIRQRAEDFLSGKEPSERFYINEVEQPRKDGSTVWTEVVTNYSFNEITGHVEVCGVTRDISERKLTEVELREEQLFSRAIVESLPGIFYLYTYPELELVLWNKQHESVFGFTGEEIKNRSIFAWHAPEAKAGVQRAVEQVIQFGHGSIEAQLLQKDGGKIPFYLTGSRLELHGKLYLLGVGSDVSEMKHAEEELVESEKKYRYLYEHAGIGIGYYKTDGTVISYNRLAASHMGGIPEDFAGKSLYELFPKDEAEFYHERLKRAAESDSSISFEDLIKLPQGEKYFTSTFTRISDSNNQTIGIQIISQDITERKLIEEKNLNLLAEKELILKEVHHRVKNNLSTINAILLLHANTLEETTAIAALNDASNRVRSMSVLYDKIYQTTDYKGISLKDYLPALISQIVSNFSNSSFVKIKTDIEDITLGSHCLSTVGIIINELLTNMMKYAFVDRVEGLITISAKLQDNLVRFVIMDNGNIIPDTVDFEKSTGFGMMLVGLLTKQIGGTIKIVRDKGTAIVLEFGNS